MALIANNDFQINDTAAAAGGVALNENFQRASTRSYKNFLVNHGFKFAQRISPSSYTALGDNTYGFDAWKNLTQTGNIECNRSVVASMVSRYAGNVRQANAASQRFGLVQWIETNQAYTLRGRKVRFQVGVRVDTTQNIRLAIVSWTGTANAPTGDIVNDWTSSTYTASNFFIGGSLQVHHVTQHAITADTTTTIYCDLGDTANVISTSANNVGVFVWTEGVVADNDDVFVSDAILCLSSDCDSVGPLLYEPESEMVDLAMCRRFYQKNFAIDQVPGSAIVVAGLQGEQWCTARSSTLLRAHIMFNAEMFAAPTLTFYMSSNGTTPPRWAHFNGTAYVDSTADNTSTSITTNGFFTELTGSGLAVGDTRICRGFWTAAAELF